MMRLLQTLSKRPLLCGSWRGYRLRASIITSVVEPNPAVEAHSNLSAMFGYGKHFHCRLEVMSLLEEYDVRSARNHTLGLQQRTLGTKYAVVRNKACSDMAYCSRV